MRAALQRFPGAGGGRTQLLLAIVILPLTTHPFRDGARGLGDCVRVYLFIFISCRGDARRVPPPLRSLRV